MITMKILIDSVEKVKEFVNITCKTDYDIDIVSGRYVIDGKSIMGIFSLNLSEPMDIIIHGDDIENDVIAELKKYKV